MRYMVLLFVCLAAVIAYVQRTALTVPTKTIQTDLDTSERGMGLVMGCCDSLSGCEPRVAHAPASPLPSGEVRLAGHVRAPLASRG